MRLKAPPLVLRALAIAAALAAGGLAAAAPASAASAVSTAAPGAVAASPGSLCADAVTTTFGPNVCVFTPAMSQTAIQADLDAISAQQVPVGAQFDSARYSLFFAPGTYGSAADPLVFQVGYYTQVAGLGPKPQDTVINGAVDVFNNLCTAGTSDCNADDNFWRSLSNLTLNVDLPSTPPAYSPAPGDPYGAGCDNSAEIWAASQAAPIRRAIINGSVVIQDYCAADDYASGGFIADSQVSGDLDFYGNQQYMVRDSSIGGANGCGTAGGGLWNMVYSGVQGAPAADFAGQCAAEHGAGGRPGQRGRAVPVHQTPAAPTACSCPPRGPARPAPPGPAGPRRARPSRCPRSSSPPRPPRTWQSTSPCCAGKNLILTPGVYNVSAPILVTRPDTVVLGLGLRHPGPAARASRR